MFAYDESMICLVEGFVTPEEVQLLNDYINSMPVVHTKDVFYSQFSEGEHDIHRYIENEAVRNLMEELTLKIQKYIEDVYAKERNLDFDHLAWTRNRELIRWKEFTQLAEHSDGHDYPPTFPIFNIGSLIYLNDEYEGGEIKFNTYDLTFKPKIGDLVLFPNHYRHEVLLVKPKEPITRRHTLPVFYSFRLKEE